MKTSLFAAVDVSQSLNRLIRRLASGRVAPAQKVTLPAAPRRGRPASLQKQAAQISAFAEEGASCSDIARRTGLAHDAVALILHLEGRARPENSTGLGTLCRADQGGWAGALGA